MNIKITIHFRRYYSTHLAFVQMPCNGYNITFFQKGWKSPPQPRKYHEKFAGGMEPSMKDICTKAKGGQGGGLIKSWHMRIQGGSVAKSRRPQIQLFAHLPRDVTTAATLDWGFKMQKRPDAWLSVKGLLSILTTWMTALRWTLKVDL